MTDVTTIHRHPVAQIQQESGLSRSAFYKRMALAGVKPIRIGQNSFLTSEQLQVLREFAAFVEAGGVPEEFPGRLEDVSLIPAGPTALAAGVGPAPLLEEESDVDDALEAPEELVAAAVTHLDGLLSFLTKAARNSWELPTSQVALLIGAKPRGSDFRRYGFTFRPVGRHGQETSWRVER